MLPWVACSCDWEKLLWQSQLPSARTGPLEVRHPASCRRWREAATGHFVPLARAMQWSLERLVHFRSRPMRDARLSAVADAHLVPQFRLLSIVDRPLGQRSRQAAAIGNKEFLMSSQKRCSCFEGAFGQPWSRFGNSTTADTQGISHVAFPCRRETASSELLLLSSRNCHHLSEGLKLKKFGIVLSGWEFALQKFKKVPVVRG